MQKNNSRVYKLVFCGGHAATTALAVIQQIAKSDRSDRYKIYWIGASTPIEGKNLRGIEHSVFPNLGVSLHTITAGRIQRRLSLRTIPSLAKIPIGFIQAFLVLLKIRPQLILSFGGYSAFPVVVIGKFLGVPVILHEQTMAVGLANKLSAKFTRMVALARKESKPFFVGAETLVVGNPLMQQIVDLPPKQLKSSKATLLITGGSRGSQNLNSAVKQALPLLLNKFWVIHQTGQLDYLKFKQFKQSLNIKIRNKYTVLSSISPLKMASYYKRADIVIGRAGANTVSELVYLGIPSILVPIPWTRYDEQNKNALMAKRFGVCTILPQDNLSGEILSNEVLKIYQSWDSIVKNMRRETAELDKSSSKRLVHLIEQYVNEEKSNTTQA